MMFLRNCGNAWKCLHTTNILGRAFRKKRCRTRPIQNSFINEASSDRTRCGINQILIKDGGGKPFNQNLYNLIDITRSCKRELPNDNLVCKKPGAGHFHYE